MGTIGDYIGTTIGTRSPIPYKEPDSNDGVGIAMRAEIAIKVCADICSEALNLPLVSREWKNGSNSSYNSTPFLHFLLTKGK